MRTGCMLFKHAAPMCVFILIEMLFSPFRKGENSTMSGPGIIANANFGRASALSLPIRANSAIQSP